MRDSSYSNEAILFFEDGSVSKEMTYSEFEAILDGVVGISDFAGERVKAAFVVVNGHLKVKSLALFVIGFDKQGAADRAWNLPLRHLAETGGAGPDLGAGPIRLACKSQCSVSWHASSLWDPNMSQQANTFVRIKEVIAENRLCLPASAEAQEPPVLPSASPPSNWGVPQPSQQKPPAAPSSGWAAPPPIIGDLDDPGLTEAQLSALESEHRNKMAALIKQQRLHVQSLKTEAQQILQSTRQKLEKDLQMAQLEVVRLRNEHESLHGQNMAIREQNEAQKKQIEVLNRSRQLELQAEEQNVKANVESLKKQYEEQLNQRIQEETAKLREDIELRNMELMHRHEAAKQLREELTQLRKDRIRLVQQGADKFLARLEDLGISFIAFHPGAGHVSITLDDMPDYMDNPILFAADKCLVSEEHYRRWLTHYQKPECQAPLTNDKVCSCRITRVDVPSQFIMGESDRCDKHKPRGMSGNVVNFRG